MAGRYTFKKLVIPVSVLVLIGAIVYAVAQNDEVEEDDSANRVAGVSVQTVALQNDVRVPVKFSGQIKGKQSTTIRALAEGILQTITPVGSRVANGTPLLRISNPSVEAGYQNALNGVLTAQANLSQTQASSISQENQTMIAVSEAEATLELAKQAVVDAQTTTSLNTQRVRDSGSVAYDNAYNTLETTMRYLGGANLNEYFFKNVLNANFEVHTQAINQYTIAKETFLRLDREAEADIETSLTSAEQTIFEVDRLNDLTVVLLSFAIPGNGLDENFLNGARIQTLDLQRMLNGIDTQVKSSRNALRDAKAQNNITLNSANKQVEIAELRLQSARNISGSQSVSSQQQNLSASSQLSTANAQLAAARYQYNNLQVPSPFAGTVISHKAAAGSQVTFGQEILEIGDLNIIEVRIQVNSDDAQALNLGQEVKINGFSGGRIVEIEPAADLGTGLVGVRVQADNLDGKFQSGRVAEVEFDLIYQVGSVIVVPLKLVQVGQNAKTLLVVENGQARQKEVELGRVFGSLVEITRGLGAGEQLIVENQAFLDSGDPVNVEVNN